MTILIIVLRLAAYRCSVAVEASRTRVQRIHDHAPTAWRMSPMAGGPVNIPALSTRYRDRFFPDHTARASAAGIGCQSPNETVHHLRESSRD